MAPGEGFEPSRPQRTTGFVYSIPGLGSSTWDLPRTRLGNPGVSQQRMSPTVQFIKILMKLERILPVTSRATFWGMFLEA